MTGGHNSIHGATGGEMTGRDDGSVGCKRDRVAITFGKVERLFIYLFVCLFACLFFFWGGGGGFGFGLFVLFSLFCLVCFFACYNTGGFQ